jgi:hypothetical protein
MPLRGPCAYFATVNPTGSVQTPCLAEAKTLETTFRGPEKRPTNTPIEKEPANEDPA